jgi:hypothetical protein
MTPEPSALHLSYGSAQPFISDPKRARLIGSFLSAWTVRILCMRVYLLSVYQKGGEEVAINMRSRAGTLIAYISNGMPVVLSSLKRSSRDRSRSFSRRSSRRG